MTESLGPICYSPEFIETLDKEGKDFPIDPMVLAILNGIKKSVPPVHNHGRGRGRSYGKGHSYNGPQGPHRPYGPGRRNLPRKKLYVESGDIFLTNIKNCLSKLSSENISSINSQLLTYELDKPDTLEEVGSLLYEAAINGVFIVDYYVDLFLSLAKKYAKIVVPLNQKILKEINEPLSFSDEEDTLTETTKQKAERYQISNICIFAELYRKGAYKEPLMRKTLNLLLEKTSVENTIPIKLIIELFQRITNTYDYRRRDKELDDILKKLGTITKDRNYPGIVRFPLMNCLSEFQNK